MKKLRIIVGGYLGLYPTGGATLDYIQYPLGLINLGHEVYYVEDTMSYPVYQKGKNWNDASGCVEYLSKVMKAFGMEDQWAYRDVASGSCFGLPLKRVEEICRTADVFINISCSTVIREEYSKIPCRILIDSDPMFTQIQLDKEIKGELQTTTKEMVTSHNFLFSFGENIGQDDCRIPTFGYNWMPTRQPIFMKLWGNSDVKKVFGFSSIMNWAGRRKLVYENENWGQKDIEFSNFKSLPQFFHELQFDMVINPPLYPESDFDSEAIQELGWNLFSPDSVIPDFESYRKFIFQSKAEFSIAKETYVKSRGGWFSGRSACYLAAGNPVVAQETGWSKFIPAGKGLFSFSDMDSAISSVKSITTDYAYHAKAAKEIAHDFFESDLVLNAMLSQLN